MSDAQATEPVGSQEHSNAEDHEVQKTAPVEPRVVDVKLSKSWELVSKKEAAARKLEIDTRARIAEMELKSKDIESKAKSYAMADEDPVEWLLQKGVSPDRVLDFVKRHTNQAPEDPRLRQYDQRLSKYEKELQETKAAIAQRQQLDNKAAEEANRQKYCSNVEQLASTPENKVLRKVAKIMQSSTGEIAYHMANKLFQERCSNGEDPVDVAKDLTPDKAIDILKTVYAPLWDEVSKDEGTPSKANTPEKPNTNNRRDRAIASAKSLSNGDRVSRTGPETRNERRARALAAARQFAEGGPEYK